MKRPRACGALIQNDAILMVRHVDSTRSYWTLPGGGIEAGETPAETAVREFWEETGLDVRVVRLLWEGVYGHGDRTSPKYCFLVELKSEDSDHCGTCMGIDPEEAHLSAEERLLQGVGWVALSDLSNVPQVA